MCQLLGMNCNTPTDIAFSFEGFCKRGGITDHHTDGFGIGFFENKGLRLFLDDQSSTQSPIAKLITSYPIKSENVISHIRKATQGTITLANTHPFSRELWGEYWLFAHNGNLQQFHPTQNEYYHPVGDTDSERAFCHILEQLRRRFPQKPDTPTLFQAVCELIEQIRPHGLFNMLLANHKMMFTHTSTLLYYIIRKAPFGQAQLIDDDITIDFSEVTTPNDQVAVIATLPLTHNEQWTQLAQNEITLFQGGEIILRKTPEHPVYFSQEEGLKLARAAGVSA